VLFSFCHSPFFYGYPIFSFFHILSTKLCLKFAYFLPALLALDACPFACFLLAMAHPQEDLTFVTSLVNNSSEKRTTFPCIGVLGTFLMLSELPAAPAARRVEFSMETIRQVAILCSRAATMRNNRATIVELVLVGRIADLNRRFHAKSIGGRSHASSAFILRLSWKV
jgi:hypothetical protein